MDKTLKVRGARRHKEFETVVRNAAVAFVDENATEELFRTMNVHSPGRSLADTRIGLLDGEIACALNVMRRALVVDGVSIPFGGIADVHVNESYRGRGYGLEVLSDAIGYMKKSGMLLSFLFSDKHGFYGKLDWSSIPRSSFVLDTSTSDFLVPNRYTVRRARVDTALRILRYMCDAEEGKYTGCVDRTGDYWDSMHKWYFTRNPSCYCAYEGKQPVAVCMLEKHRKTLHFHECRNAAGHDESPKNLVLAALCEARERGLSFTGGVLPETHPVAVKIILLGGWKETDVDLMGRINDFPALAKELCPVFEKRIGRRNLFRDGRYRLELEGKGRVDFVLAGGRLKAGPARGGRPAGRLSMGSCEFLTRIMGISGFHGRYETEPDGFFGAVLRPSESVFWNADRF